MAARLRIAFTCLLLAMLTVGTTCRAPLNHKNVFDHKAPLTADASKLRATEISAHLDIPLQKGTNTLWCGAFQLAWNEACTLVNEDLHFKQPSPIADALNKHNFTKADLDDQSYVALAGFTRDNIHEAIRRELDNKFHGQAMPHIPPKSLSPRPGDIVAYSYLFKNLEFPIPFERIDQPLVFQDQKLASFGIGEYKPAHVDLYPQVILLDYQSDQNFVIELETKSAGDRLILAKTDPAETLAATVMRVQERAVAAKGEPASSGDILKVPKINFDLTRTYAELQGKQLVTNNPAVPKDLQILSAMQNTRFQMDEKGLRLRSESQIVFGCAAHFKPRPQHIMIFDKPFLVMLQRADAKMPYFALWVENAELLVH